MRDEIDQLVSSGKGYDARNRMGELWRSSTTVATASFLLARLDSLRRLIPLQPWKLFLARSFTVEPMIPLLRAEALLAGIDLAVATGEFNTWMQEMLDPGSRLYQFQPDGIVLAAPDAALDQLRSALTVLRERSHAHVVLHTLPAGLHPRSGVFDAKLEDGEWAQLQGHNTRLRALAREFRGVHVLDYDALVARHGREKWGDELKWLTMRLPVAAPNLIHLVREWMKFLHPLTGKLSKAAVVDLDNTLWGGIIGEDGMEKIRLGPEYPGAAYQAVQRVLLDLHERGILLAIASKNNPQDALEAIDHHPGMLLSRRHFAAMRINWVNKAANLREIAAELNIGIETLAFIDDNPAEREQVRRELPEVAVIELPREPLAYAGVLRDCPWFERLALSEEDKVRGSLYAAERERRETEQSCATPEEFYSSLQQEIAISPVQPTTLERTAQLTQKTNQFNLTTRRYSDQELAAVAGRPDQRVFTMRVKDRFADNGLVGVAIVRYDAEVCDIEVLLLSCRVIGRTVETAMLSYLADRARERGCARLEGWFLPTKKNAPAAQFYAQHGFLQVEETAAGTRWSYPLSQPIPWPEWIRLIS